MSLPHAYLCLVIGLVCGWSTAAIFGGAYNVVADVVFGAWGALMGGIVVRAVRIDTLTGAVWAVCAAFVGAALCLVALRVVRTFDRR